MIGSAMVSTGLRFADPYLEREFQAENIRRSLGQYRAALLLGAATYAIFGLLDRLFIENPIFEHIVRFGVAMPALLILALLTFVIRPGPWIEPALALGALIAGLGVIAIMVSSELPQDYGHAGVMVVFSFVFVFSRLRFVYALIPCVAILLAYEVAGIVAMSMTPAALLYNNFFLLSAFVVGAGGSYTLERFIRRDFIRERELNSERERSEALLLNVLPPVIAARLQVEPGAIADHFDGVTVLFADIASFTLRSAQYDPADLVRMLDRIFTRFDTLTEHHGMEKIKTIGDAYMAVGGVPHPQDDHAHRVADMALDLLKAAAEFAWPDGEPVSMRVGISSGPVVAGVIGQSKFAYDLWGDTVNTASRMESHGAPGCIQVSAETYKILCEDYEFAGPTDVEIKGKGSMPTYLLVERRPSGLVMAEGLDS